jgi:hypothetical protein
VLRGTEKPIVAFIGASVSQNRRNWTMRGVLLWLIGIPIPIIILLYLFHVI